MSKRKIKVEITLGKDWDEFAHLDDKEIMQEMLSICDTDSFKIKIID